MTEVRATVRAATFEDRGAISALHARNALDPLDESWRAFWEAHPYAGEFRGIPIGWVLETGDGAVVGSLGNVHMLYDFGGRSLKSATATGWVVDQPFRSKSMQLITAFYRQKGVDLWINGSANPATGKVLTALKIPRIPIPDYAVPCFWATRPVAFARAALLRKSIRGAAILAYPAGIGIWLRDILYRSGRGRVSSAVSTIPAFDERFDALWQRIISGPPRLRAVRTRAALEWRFGADLRGNRAAIVVAESGGSLAGYAVLLKRQGSDMGMEMYDVADLQAGGDSPTIYRDLILASVAFARTQGVDAIKLLTGTPAKRAPAEALKPYSYQLALWQLFFKAASPELGSELASPDAWDFSLFDTF